MKKTVYAYLHTHWDREWYRELEEFRLRLVEVFDDVIKKLKNNEIPAFYFDGQTAALEDYLKIKPQNEGIIKQFIKDKKLFIGPYYCSTDSFLVDCESLIKNLQLGINYSQNFGCNNFIAYHADTFGHSKYIPQIIKYFGISNAIFWRGLGELDSEFLFNELKSTYLIEGYFHDYLSANISYEQKAQLLKKTLDRIANYSSNSILLPLGADHLALPENINEQINEINKRLKDYKIVLCSPFEYLKKVDKNYKKNIQHEFRDTKRNFILPGVLSSRIDLKQDNAKLQWNIARISQPLQAINSALTSQNYQASIDYLYKKLIQNHPHDSIYGCSTDNVHKANKLRYQEVKEGLNAIVNSVKRDLYKQNSYSVINLSNYEHKGAIKIKTTNKLPDSFNAQLISTNKGFPLTKLYRINETPITEDYTNIYEYIVDVTPTNPLSIKKITQNDIEKTTTLKITDKLVGNKYIELQIENSKITLKDKKQNKIYNNFLSFTDRADIGDSYNFGALVNDKPIQSKVIKTKIKEQGHIRCILGITLQIDIPVKTTAKGRSKQTKKHLLNLDAILENQNDCIEFKLEWVNKSNDHILQAEFNLENPITKTISDDLCGYTLRQFDSNYDIYKNIPAPRGIELKHNTTPMQKNLLVQGVGLITEGLQEYEIYKNKLRLTLLRATGLISTPHNPTRGTPAGPPIPTPDLQMIGDNTARFALCFVDSTKQLQSNTEHFYGCTLLLESDIADKTIFNLDNKNITVSTIKATQDNNLIIRLLNMSDIQQSCKIATDIDYETIYELDSMENIKKELTSIRINANSFLTVMFKIKQP